MRSCPIWILECLCRTCVVYTLCYVRCVIFKHSCHCPCRPYTHSVSPCHWCSSYQDPRSFGTTIPSFTGRICTWACCCTGARAIDFLTHDKAAAYRRKSMYKLVRHLCSDRFRTLLAAVVDQAAKYCSCSYCALMHTLCTYQCLFVRACTHVCMSVRMYGCMRVYV